MAFIGAAGCGPDTHEITVCEQVALYQEECTGEYLTPPMCDEDMESAAEYILSLSCEQIEQLGNLQGKADGAFCDWFGFGCTADESLFTGASCDVDWDCGSDEYCAEGHCFAGVDSPEMDRILTELTGREEVGGSYTHHVVDNDETWQIRRALIEAAEQSVHVTALLIEDNELGDETIRVLSNAARRGVEVRVVIDATTQYSFGGGYDKLLELAAAGGEVLPFNPVTEWAWLRWDIDISANHRLHEKILVVDGTYAVVGGRNWGDDYFDGDKWRDSDVYLEGRIVTETQKLFLERWDEYGGWEAQAGCPQAEDYPGLYCPHGELPLSGDAQYLPDTGSAGSDRARVIYSDPRAHDSSSEGYVSTIAMVRAARESIKITNSYFVPSRRLRKHLRAAANRGVKVTIVTNSLESTDAWYMYYASINYYKELLGVGIEIRQYRGTETMHAKTMVIDDEMALIGSYNLDPRSVTSNSEAMILIRDGAAVTESVSQFATDSAYTDRVYWEDISVADRIKALAFRLPEPLM
jgi:cardiolipin synthase